MNEVDLGFVFEPFKFLSAIGKNMVDFFVPGPTVFASKAAYFLPPEAASTIARIAPWTVETVSTPPISAGPTIAKIAARVAPAPTNLFATVWDTLKGPTETFLDFFLTKKQYEAAASIAQSQADTQRAAQAVVEAQERVLQQQREAEGILSADTWKKAAPYAIPIAAGLAIVALLVIIGRGREKKK